MELTYFSSTIDNPPGETLVGTDFRLAGDEGDELDLGVFRMLAGVLDGAVSVVGEHLSVCCKHVGFGDEVEGLGDGKDFD